MRPTSFDLADTIVALATPAGRSALAIVRLSGRQTRKILTSVAPALAVGALKIRHPSLVSLTDAAGETIDQGVATFFAGPASFTGEDAAEVTIHGSPVVAERLVAAFIDAGARLARPGEFTERAYRLGKVDLVEAEAIRDLIESRTAVAARFSARRMEGGLSKRLGAVREDLLAAAVALTATIDFSDDVGEEVDPAVARRLRSAAEELTRLSSTYKTGRLLSAGCRVAILGRPNAGKSTLFNALVGTARAIVTEVPGTTRDTLEATVDIRGIPVDVVDTAGLCQTQDRVEKIGVERARAEGEKADAILYVFDAAAGWQEEDVAAIAAANGKPTAIIANQIDRLPGPFQGPPAEAEPLCGLAPEAGERLRRLLERRLASEISTEVTSEVLGSLRQKDLVDRAGAAATGALEALCSKVSPEYVATHVEEALGALADVLGETTAEDVLERLFSTFCIGK